MKRLILLIVFLGIFHANTSIAGTTIANADVIKLVKAGMATEIILAAIRGADETTFNVSTDDLIELKNDGVPDAIVEAMIVATSKPAKSTSTQKQNNSDSNTFNPEKVIAINNGTEIAMRYLVPSSRMASRAFGLGGVVTYAALRGKTAILRLEKLPVFMVAIPNDSQVASYFTLVRLAQRKNGTREIVAGGGFASYSSSFPPERIIDVSASTETDQSQAPKNFTIYRVTPKTSLAKGEYSVVIAPGSAQTQGYFIGFSGSGTYFDFGVD